VFLLIPSPLEGEAGVGVIVERAEDRPDDAIEIAQHVVVPEPHDTIAARFKPCRSRKILLSAQVLLPAVNFDDEPC
jgi:hypothetical protein